MTPRRPLHVKLFRRGGVAKVRPYRQAPIDGSHVMGRLQQVVRRRGAFGTAAVCATSPDQAASLADSTGRRRSP
eukprot:13357318-Alexandrium_andersonii.AAC.1